MKVIVFLFMHFFVFCFSQKTDKKQSYNEYIDSINKPLFEKKGKLSTVYKKIKIKQEDTLYGYYKGIVGQFSKEKYLITRSNYNKKILDFGKPFYILKDWNVIDFFTKKGELIKREQTFFSKIFDDEYYIFNVQKKAIYSVGLGNNLFKMKIEDFIRILEENKITPQITKIRTGSEGKIVIQRHITSSGCYWEYQLMFNGEQPFISILISDATGKVITKSYDIIPEDATNEKTLKYYDTKDSILYPKNDGFIFHEDQILKIINKNNFIANSCKIEKYANRTWFIQSDYDKDRNAEPIMLLIDDINGEILININDYSKDIYGEEKFKKDFNQILLKRRHLVK